MNHNEANPERGKHKLVHCTKLTARARTRLIVTLRTRTIFPEVRQANRCQWLALGFSLNICK